MTFSWAAGADFRVVKGKWGLDKIVMSNSCCWSGEWVRTSLSFGLGRVGIWATWVWGMEARKEVKLLQQGARKF